MMDKPEEALLAHKIVYEKSTSNHDKAASLTMTADVLATMGNIQESIKYYENALGLAYYSYDIYLPLTVCYKSSGQFSKKDWLDYVERMETAVQRFKSPNFITDDVKNDLKNSYLYSEVEKSVNVLKSDIYWALFAAAEKGK